MKTPIVEIDPLYPPVFYACLWSMSPSMVVKWFRDNPKVLKFQSQPKKGGKIRCELRIPLSVAMAEYKRRTEG